MRSLVLSSFALSLLASTAGCGGAMGMDRGPVPVVEHAPPPPSEPVVDSAQIAEELARRPQLPARPRVAVYFAPPAEDDAVRWRWSYEERRAVVEAAADAHTLDLFALPPDGVTGTDLHSLRYAAARYGADALIVVRGSYRLERRENLWAATYALIVPILFAPAQEQEAVFVTRATMLDVRNGYIYLAAEGEASQSQQRAHVWVRADEGVDVSRSEAVRLMAGELGERLVRIRPAHAAHADAVEADGVDDDAPAHRGAPRAMAGEPAEHTTTAPVAAPDA